MKNPFQILGIVAIFLSLLAPQSSYGQYSFGKLELGDPWFGGMIFYIDETGKHGKACTEFDVKVTSWEDAKKACEEHVQLQGNFTDWYLPSKEELHQIYMNMYQTGVTSSFKKKDRNFWSSSENGNVKVWFMDFYTGETKSITKQAIMHVRAVREF